MARGRRHVRRHGEPEHAGNDDRWLLTYADMITLLMALFIVMFSISSLNTSKYESLQATLQEAFSGRILSGGESIRQFGAQNKMDAAAPEPPIPAIKPLVGEPGQEGKDARAKEDEDFRKLKAQIDEYTRDRGLQSKLDTEITRRGLVIRVLTDNLLFDSGEAALDARSRPLLRQLARLLAAEVRHPISVEGHTDDAPVRTAQYPTNWELSTLRATTVTRFLIRRGVGRRRLGAVGYASLRPVATNATSNGKARNRRVEIVLVRIRKDPTEAVTP